MPSSETSDRTRLVSVTEPQQFGGQDGGELVLEGCSGSCCCHPKSLCHRLIALIMMCMIGFGSYFCFDNPGALQNEIKEAMHVNTYQFASLYSWYSWPNVVLPVIGGYLMDSVFGIRLGTIIFAVFIVIAMPAPDEWTKFAHTLQDIKNNKTEEDFDKIGMGMGSMTMTTGVPGVNSGPGSLSSFTSLSSSPLR